MVLASCGGGNGENAEGEWVDLGLPSGTLWYSVNLGAGAPEEYGDCYAWGETRGDYWSSSLNPYDPGNAWYFYFDEEDKYVSYYYRYYGRSIRPVRHVCQ